MSCYHFIDRHRDQVPVCELCTVLQVVPSSYYAWRKRRQQPAPAQERAVVRAFQRHARRYGTWPPTGCWPSSRVRLRERTTDSGHGQRVALDRLLGQPRPTAPNQVWVGDITCLPRQGGGWLYLASWQDACSRKIVGWDVRETMPEDLVSEALRRALAVRHPVAGLIVHSDQGS